MPLFSIYVIIPALSTSVFALILHLSGVPDARIVGLFLAFVGTILTPMMVVGLAEMNKVKRIMQVDGWLIWFNLFVHTCIFAKTGLHNEVPVIVYYVFCMYLCTAIFYCQWSESLTEFKSITITTGVMSFLFPIGSIITHFNSDSIVTSHPQHTGLTVAMITCFFLVGLITSRFEFSKSQYS